MVFSWAQTLDRALEHKLRQSKLLARIQDSQYKLKHPDESRDASSKNYTKLTLRIKKEHEDNIKLVMDRRAKIHAGER